MFCYKEENFFDIASVNRSLKENPKKFIDSCEALYTKELENAVDVIIKNGAKLVMLTGPSGSGKTTTSHILCDLFAKRGIETAVISLDNFYKNSEDVTETFNGEKDFESINAIETEMLSEKLKSLSEEKETLLPVFDFVLKTRKDNAYSLKLNKNSIAIVEGIHALNSKILNTLPEGSFITVYISAHAVFKKNDETVLKKTDVRLLRRMVRDSHRRNANAEITFDFWDMVLRGERLYLKPTISSAKIKICTTFPYDPASLKNKAVPLLLEISPNSEYYSEAIRLLKALESFDEMDISLIPASSLLREFLGESKFYEGE